MLHRIGTVRWMGSIDGKNGLYYSLQSAVMKDCSVSSWWLPPAVTMVHGMGNATSGHLRGAQRLSAGIN